MNIRDQLASSLTCGQMYCFKGHWSERNKAMSMALTRVRSICQSLVEAGLKQELESMVSEYRKCLPGKQVVESFGADVDVARQRPRLDEEKMQATATSSASVVSGAPLHSSSTLRGQSSLPNSSSDAFDVMMLESELAAFEQVQRKRKAKEIDNDYYPKSYAKALACFVGPFLEGCFDPKLPLMPELRDKFMLSKGPAFEVDETEGLLKERRLREQVGRQDLLENLHQISETRAKRALSRRERKARLAQLLEQQREIVKRQASVGCFRTLRFDEPILKTHVMTARLLGLRESDMIDIEVLDLADSAATDAHRSQFRTSFPFLDGLAAIDLGVTNPVVLFVGQDLRLIRLGAGCAHRLLFKLDALVSDLQSMASKCSDERLLASLHQSMDMALQRRVGIAARLRSNIVRILSCFNILVMPTLTPNRSWSHRTRRLAGIVNLGTLQTDVATMCAQRGIRLVTTYDEGKTGIYHLLRRKDWLIRYG